jgi:hypothetical protein
MYPKALKIALVDSKRSLQNRSQAKPIPLNPRITRLPPPKPNAVPNLGHKDKPPLHNKPHAKPNLGPLVQHKLEDLGLPGERVRPAPLIEELGGIVSVSDCGR